MTDTPSLQVTGLCKSYGDQDAVAEVSFSAHAGGIFGLLAPNGAGKSTTINCICGLVSPTRGHIEIMGRDIVSDSIAARQYLGVVPQELALYEDLNAWENLCFWGEAYGLGGTALRQRVRVRVREVLEEIGLRALHHALYGGGRGSL